MKLPTTPTAVKSIFGALEYVSHCLPSFKVLGAPLMNIVKEGMNKDFVPSEIHYRSWERLTKLLDNVPSVDIFDLNKTCYLISDASLYGSGACIIQMDSLGNHSVCSKNLQDMDSSYPDNILIHNFCFIIVFAVKILLEIKCEFFSSLFQDLFLAESQFQNV